MKLPRAKKVITTLRGSISALAQYLVGRALRWEKTLRSTYYDITHIVDRVGGGDSFMGNFIYH